MKGGSQMRLAASLLGVVMVVAMAGGVGAAVPDAAQGQGGQDVAAMVKQVLAILSQVWEVMAPWVKWAKASGRNMFYVVYERASVQGLTAVAKEVGRIGFDFISGRPYLAAFEVAKDVPAVGRAVNEVIGEANLRKKAAREQEDKEL